MESEGGKHKEGAQRVGVVRNEVALWTKVRHVGVQHLAHQALECPKHTSASESLFVFQEGCKVQK